MTHFHETIIITPCEIRKWISIHLIFRGIHLLILRVFWKKSSHWVPEGIGWPTEQLANLISHNPFPNSQHSQLEITIWLSWRWHGNGHTDTQKRTRTHGHPLNTHTRMQLTITKNKRNFEEGNQSNWKLYPHANFENKNFFQKLNITSVEWFYQKSW